MSEGGLVDPLFVPDVLAEATSDRALLRRLLDFEAALAAAEADAGIVPAEAAEAIATACDPARFDIGALGRDGRGAGNPVVPVVAALRAQAGDASEHVHRGATSQDALDTALSLLARDADEAIVADLRGLAAACARLAERHRDAPMAARTLMQHALPTTFGLKAATWLDLVVDAATGLADRDGALAVQLGGGAGTLAALGPNGPRVRALLAERLGLEEPPLAWHSNRIRFAALAGALAIAASAAAKIAGDVVLLSQPEVGELAEPAGEGRGGSSAMPQKRNPVRSVLARAAAARVQAASGVLVGAIAGEHERAAGAWHAEWEPLRECLRLTGGAAAGMREVIDGIEVDAERMRANLDLTRGAIVAERVALAVSERLGQAEARALVSDLAGREGAFADELRADPRVAGALSANEIEELLDPAGYLGSAGALVDQALGYYREWAGG